MKLSELKTGSECVIIKVNGHGGLRHRLMELGFVKGERVTVLKSAPLADPIEYLVMSAHVSLRRSEADKIDVVAVDDSKNHDENYNGTVTEESLSKVIREKSNTITVALIGNPNCGKTSFFNHATGLREKVGNYSGVTVDLKIGTFYYNGYTIRLVDLPGTYSVTEYSPEERYVREYLTTANPDMVLNIIDSSNLERNLFLTTQLIDMNVRMVVALNMFDELTAKGDTFDYKALSRMLGFPIVPTTASKGVGIKNVLQTIIDVYEDRKNLTKHIHINYGSDIENAIIPIKKQIERNKDIINIYPSRYIALTALENTQSTVERIRELPNATEILHAAELSRKTLRKSYKEDISTLLTNARYAFIRGALQETYTENTTSKRRSPYKADNLLTNRWLGFPILILFLWVMFQTTFTIGAYPQEWIEMGVEWLGTAVSSWLPDGPLNDLITNGIIAGVGGVLVFLPNIVILFFFISILEDTGYMARAAFIMDRLMHKIGLHGKSFIPFITGFGCSVPAIMATRTLENRKDRFVTILATPFMSCSARLPVYLLFVSAFFNDYQGLILLSIYLIGIIFAVLTTLLLNKMVFKGLSEPFVMELPPYRIPTSRNVVMHMWNKSVQYLKKMGTVILAASIIIWALEYFPRNSRAIDKLNAQIADLQADTTLGDVQKAEHLHHLEMERAALHSENSFIGRFGHFIEPVVEPLGFDWRLGVSLTTGIAAKEVVISTMAVLFQSDVPDDDHTESLKSNLKSQKWGSGSRVGQPLFSPLVAFGFMIFVLLCTPCIATLVAIKREAGLRWAVFSAIYSTALAWVAALLIFQIGSLF